MLQKLSFILIMNGDGNDMRKLDMEGDSNQYPDPS